VRNALVGASRQTVDPHVPTTGVNVHARVRVGNPTELDVQNIVIVRVGGIAVDYFVAAQDVHPIAARAGIAGEVVPIVARVVGSGVGRVQVRMIRRDVPGLDHRRIDLGTVGFANHRSRGNFPVV